MYKFHEEKNRYAAGSTHKLHHCNKQSENRNNNSERNKFHEENQFHEVKKSVYNFLEKKKSVFQLVSLTKENKRAARSLNK